MKVFGRKGSWTDSRTSPEGWQELAIGDPTVAWAKEGPEGGSKKNQKHGDSYGNEWELMGINGINWN